MDIPLFFKAAAVGLSIAAPVGPVGLLCIQRTLAHGARTGFASGLGAATADACYGAIGALGLSVLTQVFISLATPLALAGALFLGWLGIRTWQTAAPQHAATTSPALGTTRAYLSVLVLTLANPMTILSFVGVFAAIGGQVPKQGGALGVMVLGVFAGSALWWLTLALCVSAMRSKIGLLALQRINRMAGAFLLLFAAYQVVEVLL